MVDGMAAARRGAADRAKANNLTDCAPTALHYNAHISPWGFGDFDEGWETKSGQHMMVRPTAFTRCCVLENSCHRRYLADRVGSVCSGTGCLALCYS